jgi:glutathione S-transferase
LYQFALCPFSRKVRLLLSEKRIPFEMCQVLPWRRPLEFRQLNPTGRTPAMHNAKRGIVLADSRAICEYFEETVVGYPMMIGNAEQHAEIRRLVAWFDELFYAEVVWPLLHGRLIVPVMTGGNRNIGMLPEARRKADAYLDELGFLLGNRTWLAGPTLSLADLAVAAQISVADYLGGIDWSGHEQAKTWYSVLRSRRSFQPILAARMAGIEPPPHYSNVDC